MKTKQFYSFNDITNFLSSLVPNKKKAIGHYNLDSMMALMNALGDPQEKYKVVHIAGTSGKTSTAYFVAALLQSTDQKVGLTVSPHVDSITERVQINGLQLTESEYCSEFNSYMDTVSKLSIEPTYFELILAFSFWEFARQKVDYAVVEVGMGGLLDGTNVIQRSDKVCVITDIGLDHMDFLGDTLTLIAEQKAGIIHKDNHVFAYSQGEEVDSAIRAVVTKNHGQLHIIGLANEDSFNELPIFQRRNLNLALSAVDYVLQRDELPPLTNSQKSHAANVYIPARMEILKNENQTLIIDASHNQQKMSVLVASIQDKFPAVSFDILLALSSGKEIGAVITELKPVARSMIITRFSGQQDLPKKAIDPNLILEECIKQGILAEIIEDPSDALRSLQNSKNLYKLVTGSFFLLNQIRPTLKEQGLLK
jgi:dihydrofolate synthase/folylpolyglutamate synthase